MKKTCLISGEVLTVASHFSNYFTASIHPILEVKTAALLKLLATKDFLEWQPEEAKLLFLALANSLSMLDVVAPAIAKPSEQVVAASIENLVAIAGWHTVRSFQLPKLRITAGNAANSIHTNTSSNNEAMLEFPELLNMVIATRAKTKEEDEEAIALLRLEETIKNLYSKCSIGANKTKVLRAKVADWALRVTQAEAKAERVDADTVELWRAMLTTPPLEAYKFQTIVNGKPCNVNLEELDDFMCFSLPHGCTASYEVMKHLTSMKNATVNLSTFLGVSNVIQIIPSGSGKQEAAPLEINFKSKLEYLVAKAKYYQSVSIKQEAAVASPTITIEEEPTLEAVSLGEDSSEDESGYLSEEINQL